MNLFYHLKFFLLIFIFVACEGPNEPNKKNMGCTDPLASNYNENATEDDGSCEYENDGGQDDFYSLESCETFIGPGVPEFYSKYFKCVTINMSESGEYVNIYFNGLAPYESWYYTQGDPNQIPYESQGDGYFQIPGAFIQAMDYVMSIPVNPIPFDIFFRFFSSMFSFNRYVHNFY